MGGGVDDNVDSSVQLPTHLRFYHIISISVLFFYLSIYLSTYLSIYLPIYLSIYLSIYRLLLPERCGSGQR